jgi:hypothetical protein
MDNVTTVSGGNATLPAGLEIAMDEIVIPLPTPHSVYVQSVKLDIGGDGVQSPMHAGNPLPVNIMNQGSSLTVPIANSAIKLPLVLGVAVPLPAATMPATANGAIIFLQDGDLDQIAYRYDGADPDADIYNLMRSDTGGAYFSINSRAKLLGVRLMLRNDQALDGANLTVTYFN